MMTFRLRLKKISKPKHTRSLKKTCKGRPTSLPPQDWQSDTAIQTDRWRGLAKDGQLHCLHCTDSLTPPSGLIAEEDLQRMANFTVYTGLTVWHRHPDWSLKKTCKGKPTSLSPLDDSLTPPSGLIAEEDLQRTANFTVSTGWQSKTAIRTDRWRRPADFTISTGCQSDTSIQTDCWRRPAKDSQLHCLHWTDSLTPPSRLITEADLQRTVSLTVSTELTVWQHHPEWSLKKTCKGQPTSLSALDWQSDTTIQTDCWRGPAKDSQLHCLCWTDSLTPPSGLIAGEEELDLG